MKTFLILFLIFLSLNSYSQERTYFTSFLTREPILDGQLNEDFWKELPEETNFIVLGSTSLSTKQTSFKIGYNDDAIYFGVICQEPDMDKIKARFKDGESVWGDDGVEIFISPKEAETYFQFVVNTEGFRFNSRNARGSLPLWNWRVKVYKGKDFYSLEIEIPFEILFNAPFEKNEEWRFNVARNDYTSTKERHTCWAYLKWGFHEPKNFGRLVFPQKISEEKIKPKIISFFKEKIAKNLDLLPRYKQDFSKSKEASFLRKEINLFLKDCRDLEKSFKQIEKIPFKEIRSLVKKSKELVHRGRKIRSKIQVLRRKELRKRFFE